MNYAARLVNHLSLIRGSKGTTMLGVYEEVFDVRGCVAVLRKLAAISHDIEKVERHFEGDESMVPLVNYLHNAFGCSSISGGADGIRKDAHNNILILNALASVLKPDAAGYDVLNKLVEDVDIFKREVEESDENPEMKQVYIAYAEEIEQAAEMVKYGDVGAVRRHVENAVGKLALYYSMAKQGGMFERANALFKKTAELLRNLETWNKGLGEMFDALENLLR